MNIFTGKNRFLLLLLLTGLYACSPSKSSQCFSLRKAHSDILTASMSELDMLVKSIEKDEVEKGKVSNFKIFEMFGQFGETLDKESIKIRKVKLNDNTLSAYRNELADLIQEDATNFRKVGVLAKGLQSSWSNWNKEVEFYREYYGPSIDAQIDLYRVYDLNKQSALSMVLFENIAVYHKEKLNQTKDKRNKVTTEIKQYCGFKQAE